MSERKAKGCLIAALVWCVVLAILGGAYRYLVHPYLKGQLEVRTGGTSQYKGEIAVAADSFSGYAVLRSELLRQQLRASQVKFSVQDDQGDYAARAKALQAGRVQFAVFTVDSLITSGARLGEFPGTIVLVLDETKGGDAIVAHEQGVASLQDLNHPDARIVLTPGSPSEFLARVVIAHFNLPDLGRDWIVPADGARGVFNQLRVSRPTERRAYALWEPYVSKAIEQPGVRVLLDSSKLQGYIVDVLVVQRQFLRDHPDQVRAVVEAYLRAAHALERQPGGFARLVRDDAKATGAESLDEAQAAKVVAGIQWKNTLENYTHFGIGGRTGLTHLEDIVGNIVDVLVKTRGLAADPLGGRYHTLFYPEVLAGLEASGFHPGKGLNLIEGVGPDLASAETVRAAEEAVPLTEAQWAQLRPVGELRIEPIVFTRGSARITMQSERDLQALAKRLQSFPRFYVRVTGRTRAEGDPAANRALAEARAEAAATYLRSQGVRVERLRTEAAPTSPGEAGEAQAVSFFVGQMPY